MSILEKLLYVIDYAKFNAQFKNQAHFESEMIVFRVQQGKFCIPFIGIKYVFPLLMNVVSFISFNTTV